MSTDRKIARASMLLVLASGLGHLLSLAKEMLVADRFGVGGAMDAFFAASAVPTMLGNILLTTFGAVFIPVFVRYHRRDGAEAYRIASAVSTVIGIFLLAAALLIGLCAPWIMRYGFHGLPGSARALAVPLLRVLCAGVVLSGLVGIASGILNAEGRFAAPAFSNMLITASTIVCILLFSRTAGVFALAYGFVVGLLIRLCVLLPALRANGYRHFLSLDFAHPAMRELLLLALVFFWAIVAAQVNTFVDKVMASYLAPGSIAAFGYAEKIVQVPIMVFTASLATAVFPFFSAQAAELKIDELKDSLAKSIRMAGLIFLPVTALLASLSSPLIGLFLQRGAFDHAAAEMTSRVVVFLSLGLFFYSAGIVLIRVFLAFQEIATLVKVGLVGMILNAALNLVCMRLVDPPVAGIALSTSCVYVVTMCAFFLLLRRRLGPLRGREILSSVARTAVLSAAAGAVMYATHGLCRGFVPQAGAAGQALALCAAAVCGCLAFVAGGALTGAGELRALARLAAPWKERAS